MSIGSAIGIRMDAQSWSPFELSQDTSSNGEEVEGKQIIDTVPQDCQES